jgi:cellulose synthase/poly-beta-1,6-N-acetylglucosamine synthase-like glycosyltransferase
VCAIDADTLIEPDSLQRMVRPFITATDVVAAGGTIRIVNNSVVRAGRVVRTRAPRRAVPGFQVVEYLRAFLFGRLGWNRLGGNLIISGAFGLFRRDYLLAISGYRTGNVTEDMDLVVRLQRYVRENKLPDTMPFVPDPVAWTEVPVTRAVLGRQRERWHRGLIATMWTHRKVMLNPRYGAMGMLSFPFYLLGETLAPLVELFGYASLVIGVPFGLVNWQFAVAFLVAAVGYGFLLSLWAIVLEELSFRRYQRTGDIARLVGYAALEAFGYRQLTLVFRLHAFYKYLRGVESWGHMKREGFTIRRTPPLVTAVQGAR